MQVNYLFEIFIKSSNWIIYFNYLVKLNCPIELPNFGYPIELPNWITQLNYNNLIAELNYPIESSGWNN